MMILFLSYLSIKYKFISDKLLRKEGKKLQSDFELLRNKFKLLLVVRQSTSEFIFPKEYEEFEVTLNVLKETLKESLDNIDDYLSKKIEEVYL